jgi:predicted phage tail protein
VSSAIGWGLVLGGVSSLLFTPKTHDPAATERPENKPSYAFNGPVNTTAQGNPVPVGYGRLRVGSQVISAGLYVEEWAG